MAVIPFFLLYEILDFFRKNSNYITQYLNIAATMISTIDDDPDWENGIFGEEDELLENDNIPHVVGINVFFLILSFIS